MTKRYDFAVIGAGMIGAAATRYLSQRDAAVLALGPAEPDHWQTHQGVFASHYDEARITRILDPDPVWGALAERSIAAYKEVESKSGKVFHHTAGCLRASPNPDAEGDTLRQTADNARETSAVFEELNAAALRDRFPMLAFPSTALGYWETGAAGYVNPRVMVQAQLTVATGLGADLVRETATRLQSSRDGVIITTDAGNTYQARRAILAGGAWTNLLLDRKLDLRPKSQTVLLARLDGPEAARLADVPSIICRLEDAPVFSSFYSLPAVPYPDGHVYLKIGGTVRDPLWVEPDDLREWYHGDGLQNEADALKLILNRLIPELDAAAYQTAPCVVTYTAHDRPYIDTVDGSGSLFVAAGGCGAAAKSSDEIGRLAAALAAGDDWDSQLYPGLFAAVYKE